MLPMEPKLGKMLIFGAIFNCLDPILTVAAGLSVRDPFLMPLDKKDDGHLTMLGGYLEFFMKPAVANMFQIIRRQLDEIIQCKLLFPMMAIYSLHELLSAVWLLISDEKCEGRFVFGCHVLKQLMPSVMTLQPALVSRNESGPGGDNSKGQLQTLLARIGYASPVYRTVQLKNNQFQAAVEFNGMQIMGQPCKN